MENEEQMGTEMDPETAFARNAAQEEVAKLKEATDESLSQTAISSEEILSMKKRLVEEIFSMLVESGVDPKDPEAVNEFLMTLEQKDPDLLEIFIKAFENVQAIGEAGGEPQAGVVPPEGAPLPGEEQPMPEAEAPMEEAPMPPAGGSMDQLAGMMGGQTGAPEPAGLPPMPVPTPQGGGLGSPKKQFGNITNALGMK